ncbi:MAG TPA: efflux RND transporter periplasmic adaptor subunit, partial [Burkholderiales bacterium]|nr:efflux RND transporter periplasmic adaptor subunit [Burkholderiales bacterium]
MRKHLKLVVAAVALTGLSLFAGYWIGTRGDEDQSNTTNRASGSVAAESGERKVLYYRNPMGLADTSPAPKKDPMGMDYIPVYADEAQQDGPSNALQITTEKIQKLGVRTEAAQVRALDATVRAVGRVEPNERRQYTIAPKFEGYVERLHVNATGQLVSKGQALFEAYSPELISAQREYALAIQGVESLKGGSEEAQRSMRDLAHSSLSRLRNWDISDAQIQALARSGETRRTLTFRSPV